MFHVVKRFTKVEVQKSEVLQSKCSTELVLLLAPEPHYQEGVVGKQNVHFCAELTL